MARTVTFEVPTDTSHFSPLQLQPRAVLSLVMSGWAHWVRAHLFSFRELLREHHFGVVVVGIHLTYPKRLQFFDADSLRVESGVRVRKRGTLLELDVDITGGEKKASQVRLTLIPLRVGDGDSLAATPARVEGPLLQRFQPDEVDDSASVRIVPDLLSRIQTRGTDLGEHRSPFRMHRHLCEVADQWSFIEVAGLAGLGREALSLAVDRPDLRAGLGRPLQSLDAELRRPYFIFDEGVVKTRAYALGEGLAFVHELCSSQGGEIHAVVIEQL